MTLGSARRQAVLLGYLLALVLAAAPAAFAQPATPPSEATACIAPPEPLASGAVVAQGWVINHRELPVDGTRLAPALRIDATSSTGAVTSAAVAPDGFFKLTLTPDVWNFALQLPAEWDGIVPRAPRGGLALTGCTPLAGQKSPYLIVFKIRQLVDVTARKWEELADGSVQLGAGWKITFQPINDPFAVAQTRTTAADGTATVALTPGFWRVYEWYRDGWTPLTPPQVTLKLDPYAPPDQETVVVFKNLHR